MATNEQDKLNELLSCWKKVMPNSAPRNSQITTFEWVASLPADKKYLLLEMPVGGGKSPVGITISSWLSETGYGSSFILTPQKILQKQYEDSFNKQLLHSMYGKANYNCEPKGCSCEIGSSIKPKCEACPHKMAFLNAKKSPNMVLNYTLALLYFLYVDLKPRKLMIMDECHNLESELVNFSTFSVTNKTCTRIGKVPFYTPKDMLDAYDWLSSTYVPKLEMYIRDLSIKKERIENNNYGSLSKEDEAVIKDYIRYTRHFDNVNEVLMCDRERVEQQYVLINDRDIFTVKELYGGRAFHNIVKPMAEKFLFMSSTILNKDGFCRDLQINPDEAAFLPLDSEFNRESRMVIYQPAAKMNYGWDNNDAKRKDDRKKMIKAIRNILDLHKGDSGIIHTGSFKLSQWIIDELQTHSDHYVLNHNPRKDERVKRDDIITEYMESAKVRPTVLVSPSITEGLDLKEDLGRFAIFAKVPYPSLGDAWIKRRMEISGDWYRRQTLKEMIQGSGRICRTPTDWGITYILDQSFGYLYNMTQRNVIPEWWSDGLEFM